jgi:hypothetical protein
MFLGISALVAGSAANFKLGLTDYNQKSRASLLAMEVLADNEGGSSSESSCLINSGNPLT